MGRKFTIFALFYFVSEDKFQVQAPGGGLYSEGRFNGRFFALRFGGGGAYIWRGLFSESTVNSLRYQCGKYVYGYWGLNAAPANKWLARRACLKNLYSYLRLIAINNKAKEINKSAIPVIVIVQFWPFSIYISLSVTQRRERGSLSRRCVTERGPELDYILYSYR